jgi:hypothetical protein
VARPTKPLEHGTVSAYHRGCHCDLCKKAQRDYMRNYFHANAEQRCKQAERQAVRKGSMVPITGPGKRLYWPGLWPQVSNAQRRLVRRELALAREDALESTHAGLTHSSIRHTVPQERSSTCLD